MKGLAFLHSVFPYEIPEYSSQSCNQTYEAIICPNLQIAEGPMSWEVVLGLRCKWVSYGVQSLRFQVQVISGPTLTKWLAKSSILVQFGGVVAWIGGDR